MFVWLVTTTAILALLIYLIGKPSIKVEDVEHRIRYALALCYFWAWKRSNCPVFPFKRYGKESVDLGLRPLPEAIKREHPRPLEPDLNAMDSIGFAGTSNDGHAIVVRIARRQDRLSEVIVYLKLASGEEYQLPVHPDCHVYNTDGRSFSAGGLAFEVLHPLLRWRITFNGCLIQKTDPEVTVPVRFNFIWKPMNDHMTFPHDFRADILASKMADQTGSVTELWNDVGHVLNDKQWHEQFGVIHGTAAIGDQESILLMRGLKDRKHGLHDWSKIERHVSIKGVTKHGSPFHLFATTQKDGKSLLYGYVCAPCNTIIRHVHEWSTDITKMASEQNKFGLSFKAGDRKYDLDLTWKEGGRLEVFHGDDWEVRDDIRMFEFSLNNKPGYAIVECHTSYSGHKSLPNRKSLPQLLEPTLESIDQLVLAFEDVECRSSKFVGGKGSSLALMTSLTQVTSEANDIPFQVPQGVCLTRVAFDRHLRDNPSLQNAITNLENIAWKRTQGSLEEHCDRLVTLIRGTRVTPYLEDELKKCLNRAFPTANFEEYKFAVRSSAIGEDGEELSAAGQNETFLGVKGLEEICSAIIKCWASQFSYRSIEYRRQNGQVLNGGMAVVVQQMVPAEVAGVLFTNHPVTGSKAYMFISSNYGLGESVVSASADPDTILLSREREDQLRIAEKRVGKKALKICMSADGGVVESEISSEDASECTMSDEMALKLARIAIYLEKSWGTSRDIEWAIIGNDIYLLQSRPVTTDIMLTEFELLHEFDTAVRTDEEHYSNANLGEVMPGAMTPLQNTTIMRVIMLEMEKLITWKYLRQRYDPSMVDMAIQAYGHTFMNRIHEKFFALSETKNDAAKASEVGLYGRVLDDADVIKVAIDRADKPPSTATLGLQKQMFKGFFFGGWIIEKAEKRFSQYPRLAHDVTSIAEAYRIIDGRFFEFEDAFATHITVTYKSTLWNLIVLNCIAESGKDYTLDQYTDFALLTSGSNGTESGDVPVSLRELAEAISKDIEPSKFCEMSIQDGLNWMSENRRQSGVKFQEFLKRHGHRGYKEFDVGYKTWDMQPEKVIKVMQDTLRNPVRATNAKKSSGNPVDNLKTPMSSLKKMILGWALKGARTGVRHREMGKSLVTKVIDGFRKGYRRLAQLMVKEGMLPDEDLLFFLTHDEIGQLITTRSAKYIRRAKQRQRIHPIMDAFKFRELFKGFVEPIETNKRDVKIDSVNQVTGYPVCQGLVQGPARVVHNFDQVHTIQPGDILITTATDIGWSPYFPMLAGVVTEIGGLVSHGAVVAREFGLPCVVGAQNATTVFKSGEIVLLNANKGIIAKVTE